MKQNPQKVTKTNESDLGSELVQAGRQQQKLKGYGRKLLTPTVCAKIFLHTSEWREVSTEVCCVCVPLYVPNYKKSETHELSLPA